MSKMLKTQLFANTNAWVLSPRLLHRLATKFISMSPKFQIYGWEKFDKLKDASTQDAPTKLNQDFRRAFRDALFNLKLVDDENKDVIVQATLIAMLINADGADYLADIIKTPRGNYSSGDFIVIEYLKNGVDNLRIALRAIDARKPKSYHYYVPKSDLFLNCAVPREPSLKLIAVVQDYLSKYFEKEYKSALCDIAIGRVDNLFYLDISHAGPFIHGEQVEPESTKVADYVVQPVVYDTLIFDLVCGDLRVHMDSSRKSVVDEYIKVVGELFFENDAFWGDGDKYTLAPLNGATGEDVNRILDVENARQYISMPNSQLSSLNLRRLVFSKLDSLNKKIKTTCSSESCISTDLKKTDRLIPIDYSLDNVMFSISFVSVNGKSHSLNMNLHKNRRNYEGNVGCDGLDEWLNASQFTMPPPKDGYAGQIPEWFEKMENKQVKAEAHIVQTSNMVTEDEETFELSNES